MAKMCPIRGYPVLYLECQECEDKKICGKAEWNHVQVAGIKGNCTGQKLNSIKK